MSRRGAGLLTAVVLAVLGAGRVLAYVQTNLVDGGSNDVGLYQSGTFVVRLEQDASFRITDGTDLTALRDTMTSWTAVATSDATISEGVLFNLASPVDASSGLGTAGNRLIFAETDTNNRIGGAIAVAFFSFGPSGAISDCDIVMNERLFTFSTTTPANPNQILGSSTYDIGEIATHEMGHCLGMEHSPIAGRFSASTGIQVSGFTSGDFAHQSTLYPFGTRTIQGRSLSDDDIAGVSFIYPNPTLNSTRGVLSGRVQNGADFSSVKGAHVVAVTTAAPDVPVAGVISGVQEGGPGGEFNIFGLAPGSYYLRLEPLVGTSNPFTQGNTHFTGFVTGFPPEYYDGATESGFDNPATRTAVTVVAGETVTGLNLFTNVGAPDANEPNNTRPAATPINCEIEETSSIVPTNDVDYYALTITAPTSITVDISAARTGSSLDAVAAVFDAGGTILGFADNTISLDPVVSVNIYTPGTYYIGVASYDDGEFDGSGGLTAGSYSLALSCEVPHVPVGLCSGRVLFAGNNSNGSLVALSDIDGDLEFDGLTSFYPAVGSGQGQMGSRRDGGVTIGFNSGAIKAYWDDSGDFVSDRSAVAVSGLSEAAALATLRRSGAEYVYSADLFAGGTIVESVDTDGDLQPERTTVFTSAPVGLLSLAVDEAGTLYALDGLGNDGLASIMAYHDDDGDGDADRESIFVQPALQYAAIAALRQGEVFAADYSQGQIDRLRDTNGDGVADLVIPYATGLALNIYYGIAFNQDDVPFAVDGETRVLALPDDDGDGDADRQVQFSPLMSGVGAIAFGRTPPEEVSPPGSYAPVRVTTTPTGLRLHWEEGGPTVPAYNIYQGAAGGGGAPAPLLCHVTGASDGLGGRYLDLDPAPAGDASYLVTASDGCGEGSFGRRSDGTRRPVPGAACGGIP